MMRSYRYLNSKDEKRLKLYRSGKKNIKKFFKWTAIGFGIALVFFIGLIAFYSILDKNVYKSYLKVGSSLMDFEQASAADDTEGLNEHSKRELERESEKEKIISHFCDVNEINNNTEFFDFSQWNQVCDPELIIVNAGNCLPSNFKAKTKICRGKEVSELASEELEHMISDAKKDGIILWISSGYRSEDLQVRLFNRQVEIEKSKEKEIISQEEAERRAAKLVAPPSASEHHTGLAIDFNGIEKNFYATREYKWLMDNAHKYGFIERYLKKWANYTGIIYEPWHFRYVGKENASLIKESGLCLEEYVKNKLIDKVVEEKYELLREN